jgi:hypothetical protein
MLLRFGLHLYVFIYSYRDAVSVLISSLMVNHRMNWILMDLESYGPICQQSSQGQLFLGNCHLYVRIENDLCFWYPFHVGVPKPTKID